MNKAVIISKWEVLTEALMEAEENTKGRVWTSFQEIPAKKERFIDLTEENLIKYWGRQWKKTLKNVVNLGLKAAEMSLVGGGCYREACVSCTNPKLKKAIGLNSNRTLAKAITDAKDIGVLLMTDDEYKIGKCGRKYVVNDQRLNNLITILNNTANGHETSVAPPIPLISAITPYTSTPSIMLQSSDLEDIFDEIEEEDEDGMTNVEDWKFEHGYNTNVDDKTVIKGIYKHYPWLRDYQAKVEEINNGLSDFFRMQFQPSVKRNKGGKVNKVGIRCTSQFASTRSEGRKEMLKQMWNVDEIYDYDVKSSIYRVTYYLNHGEWLPKDVDLYQEIMTVGHVTFKRKNFKKLAMGLYFGKTAKQSLNWWVRKMRQRMQINICEEDKNEYKGYWEAMREVVGKCYSSEIFLHESCIYIDLLAELIKRGYRVGQVYDGFYSDRPIEDVCEELLPVIAKRYAIKAGFQKEEVKTEEPKAEEPKTEKIEIPYQTESEMEANKTAEELIDDLFAEDVKTEEEVKTKTQPTPLTEEELDALLDSLDLTPYEQTSKDDNTWQHARYIAEAQRREAEANKGKREFMMMM